MTKRSRDEELRMNLSTRLDLLSPGQRIVIRGDELRRFWPEQSEEELRALWSTNDLKQLVSLMATAHECDHELDADGNATFIKKD